MKDVDNQKVRLEQRKVRLAAEETRLKLKEHKMRTRRLIELGGLLVKANIDFLETNTLYGALLSLSAQLDSDSKIKDKWTKTGATKLSEEEQKYTAVIIKFEGEPEKLIRDLLRSHGMKWNKFRHEWYGNVTNLDQLKQDIGDKPHNLEIINNIKIYGCK